MGKNFGIDVVIPVFNGEDFILQAIRSVFAQSLPPARIIVVDDGSTDGTRERVKSLTGNAHVQYVSQENRGLSAARNTGILHARSEFVAFLDADDEWHPKKLEEQSTVFRLSSVENLGVVYSNYCLIDAEGSVLDVPPASLCPAELRGCIFPDLFSGNRISGSGSGVLVKRECFERAGLFDEQLKACEDWDMWLRLAMWYGFDYAPGILVRIRQHSQNMQKDRNYMFRNMLVFYSKWSISGKRVPHLHHWRNSIVYRIAEDLPSLEALQLTRHHLSSSAAKILFRNRFGSPFPYLLCRFPAITIILLKRMLGIKEYA